MYACRDASENSGLVLGLLQSSECRAQALVEASYGPLGEPGGLVSTALTVLLTLYVAILGYRLMLGRAPLDLGDLTLSVVRIGLVLLLALNWPAYQRLVVATLSDGPPAIAGTVLGALGASPPLEGLQAAYDRVQDGAAAYARRVTPQASPLVGGPGLGAAALTAAGVMLLASTLGVLLAARSILAILLGLGPLFVGLVLFDATRGVAAGALRAGLGLALLGAFTTISLALNLALLEAPLAQLELLQDQPVPDTTPAIAVLVLSLVTTLCTLAGALAASVVAWGLRLPGQALAPHASRPAPAAAGSTTAASTPLGTGRRAPVALDRARAVAAAAAALDRREAAVEADEAPRRAVRGGLSPATSRVQASGYTYRRPAAPRRAASTARRDR